MGTGQTEWRVSLRAVSKTEYAAWDMTSTGSSHADRASSRYPAAERPGGLPGGTGRRAGRRAPRRSPRRAPSGRRAVGRPNHKMLTAAAGTEPLPVVGRQVERGPVPTTTTNVRLCAFDVLPVLPLNPASRVRPRTRTPPTLLVRVSRGPRQVEQTVARSRSSAPVVLTRSPTGAAS